MNGQQHRHRPRHRGIALLMTLVVVVLLTMFISEFFFTTGLELRAIQTFKEAHQAQFLARSAFKVIEIGLLQDEVEFFRAYRDLRRLLTVASLPWEQGLLIDLQVQPQDGLYNLNEFYGPRPGTPKDIARWEVFRNIVQGMELPSQELAAEPERLEEFQVRQLYAALVDWIDGDDVPYTDLGTQGAESDVYFSNSPEFTVRNGPLHQLSEIRLVRGVTTAGLSWQDWESRFTAIPKRAKGGLYPEKINVNVATQDEIFRFLEARRVERSFNSSEDVIRTAINAYADHAADIAQVLAGDETGRRTFTNASLSNALKGVTGINSNYGKKLFALFGEYYRVKLTTELNGIQAHLEATLYVPRKADRTGKSITVLSYAPR